MFNNERDRFRLHVSDLPPDVHAVCTAVVARSFAKAFVAAVAFLHCSIAMMGEFRFWRIAAGLKRAEHVRSTPASDIDLFGNLESVGSNPTL